MAKESNFCLASTCNQLLHYKNTFCRQIGCSQTALKNGDIEATIFGFIFLLILSKYFFSLSMASLIAISSGLGASSVSGMPSLGPPSLLIIFIASVCSHNVPAQLFYGFQSLNIQMIYD